MCDIWSQIDPMATMDSMNPIGFIGYMGHMCPHGANGPMGQSHGTQALNLWTADLSKNTPWKN